MKPMHPLTRETIAIERTPTLRICVTNALRPILSELGALPVSAMIHVPKAGEAFDEDGAPREDADRWAQYADRGVAQLEWWATAAREHRSKVDPTTGSPAFTASPSQRNAP